ncbi:Brix domain [Arabidopsis thaliana x Arabidopsis arenosa]|uniref:Brix domain n=1 Tax=Arabidopsis thaliana x Arabidopsis arenosa TaxID=1240361 RepID=A0A8T2C661_9BRAS|nr:Brix domain [Arabidopsis thaliana x Arabidopsis arenosa]
MDMMMETAKAEELVQSKMRREITSLDDDELWAEFEPEGIDRVLSGEIKPKTLITNYGVLRYRRGALIAKEMLSVFPNSTYIKWKWGFSNSLKELIGIAKERACTSLVLARTNSDGYDEIRIVSLLNGAAAEFSVLNLIPREDIPDQASPPIRLYPEVTDSGPRNGACRRNIAFFQNQKGCIHYRHYWNHAEEVSRVGDGTRVMKVTKKECGPQFVLMLTALSKIAVETGSEKRICVPPWITLPVPPRILGS